MCYLGYKLYQSHKVYCAQFKKKRIRYFTTVQQNYGGQKSKLQISVYVSDMCDLEKVIKIGMNL